MKLTVIISYYKALDNLKIILKALDNQNVKSFDVILSEDDYNEETVGYIKENEDKFSFSIIHLCQAEDLGFRKNSMLNRAVLSSQNKFLIFIDGDCIPHRSLVKEYIKNLEEGYFFSGRAVMLSEGLSKKIIEKMSLWRLHFISVLFSKSKMKKEGFYFPFFKLSLKSRGLVGRNWGAFKQDLLSVNGFDNDYVFAGVGEDVDVEWRLLANGLKRKSMKNKAITYHVFHERLYSQVNVKNNYTLFYDKQKQNHIKCLNGINYFIENKTIGN